MHSELAGNLSQFRLPLPRCECLLVEIVKDAAIPQGAALDSEIFLVAADGDCVRSVGLQLDGVRTGVFGGMDNANGLIEVLILISGKLGDAIDGTSAADATAFDFDVVGHICHADLIERTSSNASTARRPTTLPHRVAIARSASPERG